MVESKLLLSFASETAFATGKLNEIVNQNLTVSVRSCFLSSTCGYKITSEVGIVASFEL